MFKSILAVGTSSLALSVVLSGLAVASPSAPQGCAVSNPAQVETCLPARKDEQEHVVDAEEAPEAPLSFAEQMNPAFDAWINGGDANPAGNDNDQDTLADLLEILLGTDPNANEIADGTATDNDNDGIPDYADPDPTVPLAGLADILNDLLGYDSTTTDSDGDGLSDYTEIVSGTNPFNADSDHDGVDDAMDNFPTDPTQQKIVPPQDQGAGKTPPMWHWENSGQDADHDHNRDRNGGAGSQGNNNSNGSNTGGTSGSVGGVTP